MGFKHIINAAASYNEMRATPKRPQDRLIGVWKQTFKDPCTATAALALQSLFDPNSPVKSGVVAIGAGYAQVASETTSDDGSVSIISLAQNGKATAMVKSSPNVPRADQFATLGTNGCGSEVYPLYVPVIGIMARKDPAFADKLTKLDGIQNIQANVPGMIEELASDIVNALENEDVLFTVPSGNTIGILTPSKFSNHIEGQGVLLYGNAPQLAGAAAGPTGPTITLDAAKKLYSSYSADRNWTEEELSLIPDRDGNEVCMPEVREIAEMICATKDMKRPYQNFMWRGITGYGKSTGMEQLAYILNMPLLRVTCDPDKEVKDYLVMIEPVVTNDAYKLPEIDGEELMFNPPAVAAQLLGLTEEECTEYDTVQSVLALYRSFANKASGSSAMYRETRGDYLRALEDGYLVEVQEPSRIKKQGVLVGLNEFDRPGARIPLLNERSTHRHQKAIVVFTDNIGYSTCRELDPSVIRRFHQVIDSFEMSESYVRERCMVNAEVKDPAFFKLIYKVWLHIQNYATSQGFPGPCSIVELENLLITLKVKGMTDSSAILTRSDEFKSILRSCVVSKTTNDQDSQDAAISGAMTVLQAR